MRNFAAHATQSFSTEPGGAATRTETLDLSMVSKGETRGASPPECLLIGVDVEYQAGEPVEERKVRAGEVFAKNDILSYQYAVKRCVSGTGPSQHPVISGIIVPADGNRLALKDVLVFAIAHWSRATNTTSVPSHIFMGCHFNPADLTAFSDFGDLIDNFEVIRRTFITLHRGYKLELHDGAGGAAEFYIQLRDTTLLAPEKAKSLTSLGEFVGLEKVKLHEDQAEEVALKRNMRELRASNWPLFRRYAVRDPEIVAEFMAMIIERAEKTVGRFGVPPTLTSFGTALLIRSWKDRGWDPDALIGREKHKYTFFDPNRGHNVNRTKRQPLPALHLREPLVKEGYFGGNNQLFQFGPLDVADWSDWDLVSAYPTAMALIGLPDWAGIQRLESLADLQFDDLAVCHISFKFDGIKYPTLPVRRSDAIAFPEQGETVCNASEILVASQLGAEIVLHEGYLVPTDRSQKIFLPFIRDCVLARAKCEPGSFDEQFYKMMVNAVYGKSSQGTTGRRSYDHRNDRSPLLPQSKITQLWNASFATAYARAVVGHFINALPSNVDVAQVLTDGFLTNASDAQIEALLDLPVARKLRQARLAMVGDDKILQRKHRLKQPLPWTSRGLASLQP